MLSSINKLLTLNPIKILHNLNRQYKNYCIWLSLNDFFFKSERNQCILNLKWSQEAGQLQNQV